MKEIMDTSLVEGYIFLFEVLDMVGKECQHVLLAVIGLLAQRLVGQCAYAIEYVVVRGSCRYRLSEILRLLEDNTVRNEEGTIDTLFHNHTLRTGGKPKGRRT